MTQINDWRGHATSEWPRPPIVAISPNIATGRRLAVVWGVHAVITEDAHDQDGMVDRACRIPLLGRLRQSRPAHHHLRRRSHRHAGATNMLRIAHVAADDGEQSRVI